MDSAESQAALERARAALTNQERQERADVTSEAKQDGDLHAERRAETEWPYPDVTLGQLIARLERCDPAQVVAKGFASAHSYRGYYDCVSFTPAANTSVGPMLSAARSALGNTFHGYKGGDYKMTADTPCWIACWGDCGEPIMADALERMLAPAPSPAPAPVRPVAGGEVEARDVRIGTLFTCGGDVYLRICDSPAWSGSLTTHRVGSEHSGAVPHEMKVRPLTLAPLAATGDGEQGGKDATERECEVDRLSASVVPSRNPSFARVASARSRPARWASRSAARASSRLSLLVSRWWIMWSALSSSPSSRATVSRRAAASPRVLACASISACHLSSKTEAERDAALAARAPASGGGKAGASVEERVAELEARVAKVEAARA